MTPKSLSIAAVTAALLLLLAVGLAQLAGGSTRTYQPQALTPAQTRAALAGSPPLLAALHAQASEILPGGEPALRARLSALRGIPVVINKWASWCEPCRAEAAVFQRVSVSRGREVAFIGIDSEDSRAGALAFLRSSPLSYPSYYDRSGALGTAITDSAFTPVTVIYNRRGGMYIHQGPYPSVSKLEQDIRRYGLDA